MSNVEDDPTPSGDPTEGQVTASEPSRALPPTDPQSDNGLPAAMTGIDAFVSATESEEGKAILGERAPERVDPKPLIEAMEALSRGIRRELQVARDRTTGATVPAHGSELQSLVEAAQTEIRRMRAELGAATPVRDSSDPAEASGVASQEAAPGGQLVPLIDVFEAQVQGIRRELDSAGSAVENPALSPPLASSAPPLVDSINEGALGSSAVSSGDGQDRRRLWLFAAAAAVGVVAVGSWIAWTGQSRAPQGSGRLDAPQSASTERSKPATETLPAPPVAESSQTTTPTAPRPVDSMGTSGSDAVTSPPAAESKLGGRKAAPQRSQLVPPQPVTIVPGSGRTLDATPPTTSEVSRAAISEPGPDKAPAAAPTTAATAPDPAAKSSAGAPLGGGAASPGTTADPSSTLLTRPATVLTRVQPRRLVEVLSGEMSAVVEVQVAINSEGRPYQVRAVSGPVALRAPAEDTVRRWTFSPALQSGEPVDGALKVTVTFGPWVRDMRYRRRLP